MLGSKLSLTRIAYCAVLLACFACRDTETLSSPLGGAAGAAAGATAGAAGAKAGSGASGGSAGAAAGAAGGAAGAAGAAMPAAKRMQDDRMFMIDEATLAFDALPD